jgi:uncharacterized membrane protein YeaQ/YmgE (transglycosylase-associated protein family)
MVMDRDISMTNRAERRRNVRHRNQSGAVSFNPPSARTGRPRSGVREARQRGSRREDRETDMDYGIIGWIVIGLIAGALAKFIMPGRDPGGIIVTILLGIVGAVIGGFIATALGLGAGGNIWNIIIATLGAVILLWIYRAVSSRRTTI